VKVLVYGAGVIGTLYGAKLADAGHKVTVIARGRRFADICQYGLVLEDIVYGRRWIPQVKTVERLSPDDESDLALITVRRDQLASAVAELATNKRIPTLLFMLNNPTGSASLAEVLGRDRVILGFPGAGGTRDGHVVRYAMIAQQPTTLGELDGRRSARLGTISKAFSDAGLPTHICVDMDAWLKAHAFFVTAMCGAIYIASGDCRKLSRDSATLKLMTNGVREGFAAVRALGLPVMPFSLRVLFTWLPDAFAVAYWRRFLATEMADYVFGRHARAAAQEMHEIAKDCRALLERSGVDGAALLSLYRAIDAYVGSVA
jgi:2-dehydropantoate 2-reductase